MECEKEDKNILFQPVPKCNQLLHQRNQVRDSNCPHRLGMVHSEDC